MSLVDTAAHDLAPIDGPARIQFAVRLSAAWMAEVNAADPQGRPAVLRAVRLGPPLDAQPADRSDAAPGAGRGWLLIVKPPGEVVAEHELAAPGEARDDAHCGGPRPAPNRATRPNTRAQKQFCALGQPAEASSTNGSEGTPTTTFGGVHLGG